MIFLIRRAVKRLKKVGYKTDLATLNEEGECKFVAIADAQVTQYRTKGILLERPSLLMGVKQWLQETFQKNKRVFAAIETEEGKILFLLFHPDDLKDIVAGDDADALLEEASLDSGFATDRGLSVLTSDNTVVKKGSHEDIYFFGHDVLSEHVYCFQPKSSVIKFRKDSFEIKLVIDENNQHSKDNMEATEKWMAADILTLKQNSPEMSMTESLKVEK